MHAVKVRVEDNEVYASGMQEYLLSSQEASEITKADINGIAESASVMQKLVEIVR